MRTEYSAESVLDAALEAFVSISVEGRVEAWNPAAERTFGWSRAEASGQFLDELIIPERFRHAHRAGLALLGAASILAAITIARPPITEQNEIARHLKSLNTRIRFEEEELEKRRFEKSGLMDDLLTGHVRVTPLLAETEQQGST